MKMPSKSPHNASTQVSRRVLLLGSATFALSAIAPAQAGTYEDASVAFPAPKYMMALPRRLLSSLTGRKISFHQVMKHLFAAGFRTEEQLLAGTAIAIAESGLYSAARNWHPEKGLRPASDVITVRGPKEVWSGGQQLHSDRGIWQIASFWHSYYPDTETDDPARCAQLAYIVSAQATDFRAWTSYASGSAQRHYNKPYQGWPALAPLVRRFLKYQSTSPENT